MTAPSIESGYTHGFVFLQIAAILETAVAVAVRPMSAGTKEKRQ